MARITSTHELTCKSSELCAQLIQEFLDPLEGPTPVKIELKPQGQLDETLVRLSADVDINRGRIY